MPSGWRSQRCLRLYQWLRESAKTEPQFPWSLLALQRRRPLLVSLLNGTTGRLQSGHVGYSSVRTPSTSGSGAWNGTQQSFSAVAGCCSLPIVNSHPWGP